jgi:hypothetical protein
MVPMHGEQCRPAIPGPDPGMARHRGRFGRPQLRRAPRARAHDLASSSPVCGWPVTVNPARPIRSRAAPASAPALTLDRSNRTRTRRGGDDDWLLVTVIESEADGEEVWQLSRHGWPG